MSALNGRLILHVVYIHGFQGDHTTFQSFPTDLHHALQPRLPEHVELRSTLYPTYKSKRPIGVATENFLKWLESLPEGPVVLCGHSMGGLLAAEAATSPRHAACRRVVALLAFDVPFLGMHPHVVVSGIASLLPGKKGGAGGRGGGAGVGAGEGDGDGLKSEREMNDARHVDIPLGVEDQSTTPSANASHASLSVHNSHASGLPSPPPRTSSSQTSQLSSWTPSSSPIPTPAVVTHTLDFLQSHADDPVVRFITKHRSEPLAAAKRWVVESFEFGVCMFDPKGLRARYGALDRWQGKWVAFWTETVPPGSSGNDASRVSDVVVEGASVEDGAHDGLRKEREDTASLGRLLEPASSTADLSQQSLLQSDSSSRTSSPEPPSPLLVHGPPTKSENKASEKQTKAISRQHEKEVKSREKAKKKQQEKELKALQKQRNAGSPHHFVVRPFSPPKVATHFWERVSIRGAKDEVEAHCGLFLKDVNWEYDAFVQRVASVVEGWAECLPESAAA